MQSKCPVCEVRVEEKAGEYICPKCKASWKEHVWKQRSLFPSRPGWFVRNRKHFKKLFLTIIFIFLFAAGVAMAMKPIGVL
jgi:tRNA(Ile2) C34 agmatinyltransferase TiaS